MRRMRWVGWVVLACCGGAAGCSDSDDAHSCMDVSGNWSYAQHCESAYIGKTASVAQSGCSFTSTDPVTGDPVKGSVRGSSVSLTAGKESCSGSLVEGMMTLDCGGCKVELRRP